MAAFTFLFFPLFLFGLPFGCPLLSLCRDFSVSFPALLWCLPAVYHSLQSSALIIKLPGTPIYQCVFEIFVALPADINIRPFSMIHPKISILISWLELARGQQPQGAFCLSFSHCPEEGIRLSAFQILQTMRVRTHIYNLFSRQNQNNTITFSYIIYIITSSKHISCDIISYHILVIFYFIFLRSF